MAQKLIVRVCKNLNLKIKSTDAACRICIIFDDNEIATV